MKINFLPQTKLGKWATILIVLMPALFVAGSFFVNLFYSGVPAGDNIIDDLRARPLLAVPMLAGMLSGLTSFAVNLIAIFKKDERSVFAIIAALAGLLLVFFLFGEIFTEH